MAIITSVINMKGGVGKTTLAHHLGTGLTYKRKRTLIVDLDPQCNLSYLAIGVNDYYERIERHALTIKHLFEYALEKTSLPARKLILKNTVTSSTGNRFNHVDLVLSHTELPQLDDKLARYSQATATADLLEKNQDEFDKLSIIKRLLDQVQSQYDYIFLDCPADLHLVTQNAIFASDFYLIPTMPDYLSTVGISQIRSRLKTMNQQFAGICAYLGEPYTPIRCAGIVFNKVSERLGQPIQSQKQYINQIRSKDPDMVFDSYLVAGDGISIAAQQNSPLYTYYNQRAPHSKIERQLKCLDQILTEFLIRVNKEERK